MAVGPRAGLDGAARPPRRTGERGRAAVPCRSGVTAAARAARRRRGRGGPRRVHGGEPRVSAPGNLSSASLGGVGRWRRTWSAAGGHDPRAGPQQRRHGVQVRQLPAEHTRRLGVQLEPERRRPADDAEPARPQARLRPFTFRNRLQRDPLRREERRRCVRPGRSERRATRAGRPLRAGADRVRCIRRHGRAAGLCGRVGHARAPYTRGAFRRSERRDAPDGAGQRRKERRKERRSERRPARPTPGPSPQVAPR